MTPGTMNSKRWCTLLMALTVSTDAFAQVHGPGTFAGHEGGAQEHSHSTFGPHEDAAQEHGNRAFAQRNDVSREHFQAPDSHNHDLDRRYTVHAIPHGVYRTDHDRRDFRYEHGEWYHRQGRDWMATRGPTGAFVSFLPPVYTTVWFGGMPYYYADATYYDWDDSHQEYEVVEPQAGIEAARTIQPTYNDQIMVYPRYGQSAEQQARDRSSCDHDAAEQSGYDPTQTIDAATPEVTATKRGTYLSVEAACLDAHGYSIK
jgi:hypothetical protein